MLKDVSLENCPSRLATTSETVYVVCEVPLAAVTTTVKVFVPVLRPVAPVTTAVAAGSLGSATTVTEVTPLSRFTDPLWTTSLPFTEKTPRVESSLARTFKVTV